MQNVRSLIPVLLTGGLMLGANGLHGTYVALRGTAEGFSPSSIGLMAAAFNIGFVIGCLAFARLLRKTGSLGAFASMAGLTALCCGLMSVVVHPVFWLMMRLVAGFALAGMLAVTESWINARTDNGNRGRTLSIYRLIDLGAVSSFQFLLPALGLHGHIAFLTIGGVMMLASLPISFISDKAPPPPPPDITRFNLRLIWRISPQALIGVFASGLTVVTFRTLGPLYGHQIGLSVTMIAAFMSTFLIGGALLQYPLGHLSDRRNRRLSIRVSALGAALACGYLVVLAGRDPLANIGGILVFGAFGLPLYSLCLAKANDRAQADERAVVSAGLLFARAAGAILGPLLASWLLETISPHVLFVYAGTIFVVMLAVTFLPTEGRAPTSAPTKPAAAGPDDDGPALSPAAPSRIEDHC